MIIGITGPTGSGKTTIATKVAEKLGNSCEILSVDKVGHEAISFPKVKEKLIERFGDVILTNDKKSIDRKKLGAVVFNDNESMIFLKETTWPYMEKMIFQKIRESEDNKCLILEYSLLPLCGLIWDKCDLKVLITSPEKTRVERLVMRDKISASYLRKRNKSSIDYSPYKSEIDKSFKNVNYNDVNKATLSIIAEIEKFEKIRDGKNITRGTKRFRQDTQLSR